MSMLRSLLRSPSLLRHALLGDALVSGATGLLLVGAAAALAGPLGLPESLLRIAGASLLPFAAIVSWVGTRAAPSRAAVWAIVAYNAMWVLESFALLVLGWYAPSALGIAFVVAQALAVAAFAELQVFGLRAARPAAA
ncbi:MAG TPA: hypothetical protein VGE10_09365 [Zeimonas sp.]